MIICISPSCLLKQLFWLMSIVQSCLVCHLCSFIKKGSDFSVWVWKGSTEPCKLILQLKKQRGGDRERSNLPYEYIMRPVPDLHKVVQICFIVWRPLEMWSLKNGDNKCCCTSISGFGTGNSVTLQLNKLSASNFVNATVRTLSIRTERLKELRNETEKHVLQGFSTFTNSSTSDPECQPYHF